jgi:ribosomal protein L11 methyltransferase
MIELFPAGFEELEHADAVELVAYTDAGGEERLWAAFGEVRSEEIAPDWEERWREFHRSVRVGSLWIGPPWEEPPADLDAVVVEPGRAFGTGGHATTRLCLELLQEIDLSGKRVIDVGTGSGVLAIAASRLGAREVVALDHDPDALRNARENIARNSAEIQVLEADLSAAGLEPADIVLANLTSAVLQRFAETLTGLVARGGVVIVSGFSPDDVDDVTRALGAARLKVLQDGDWAAATLTVSRSVRLPPSPRLRRTRRSFSRGG